MSIQFKPNILMAVILMIGLTGMVNLRKTNASLAASAFNHTTDGKGISLNNPKTAVDLSFIPAAVNLNQWKIWGNVSGDRISMLSDTDGWIADFEGKIAILQHWNGDTWASAGSVTHPDYEIVNGDIQMVSASDGWITFYGDDYGPPYYPPESVIYRWDGYSWNLVETLGGSGGGVAMSKMDILSGNDIWAVAGTMFGTKFFHWDGEIWSEKQYLCCDINLFSDIDMLTPMDGWAVGYSGTTHWNGSIWSEPVDPAGVSLKSISMVSDQDGWIVGVEGSILHWNNASWSEIASPVTTALNSIAMLSATDGWAVGDSGVILHWNGSNWQQTLSPTVADLNEIAMISADEGWIVGDGVVLHYEPSSILSSNYTTGQPGSYFNLSGSSFPPNNPVAISINGRSITSTISTDSSGVFTFTLSTQQAETGRYFVMATVNPSATTDLILDGSQPLREKEGDYPVINLPSGIALINDLYLSVILR